MTQWTHAQATIALSRQTGLQAHILHADGQIELFSGQTARLGTLLQHLQDEAWEIMTAFSSHSHGTTRYHYRLRRLHPNPAFESKRLDRAAFTAIARQAKFLVD